MEVKRWDTRLNQMAISNANNLRDLLKFREESELRERESLSLGEILGGTELDVATARSRSLLDIIREEKIGSSENSVSCSSIVSAASNFSTKGYRLISWKCWRDRLRRRGSTSANAWIFGHFVDSGSAAGTGEAPTSENFVPTGSTASLQTDLAAALAAERQQQLQRRAAGRESPARIPLMALLENDNCSLPFAMEEEEDNDDEEVEEEDELGKGKAKERSRAESLCCCVCMTRKKGAAFIPCGHTFCRACTRELWISRGCCPLCNARILEVLDIF